MNKQLNFSVVEPIKAEIPKPVEKKGLGAARYVAYGENNQYPEFLLQCYEDCATLQAVINRMVDYICGAGFMDSTSEERKVNVGGMTRLELVKKATMDYMIFGAFAIGVRRNHLHAISDLDYHDPRTVRLSEDGKTAYVCNSWSSSGNKAANFPVYNPSSIENHTIFYYRNPKSRGLYGKPVWSAVTKDVQTAIEISTFHLQAIKNNFNGSAIVNFNNGTPAVEVQEDIEKRVQKKFGGAGNAGRIVVCFNDSREQQTTISALPQNSFDQKYAALSTHVRENIFIAFSAHPQLFGADPERQGFNSMEYEQSFKLFKETVVSPLQKEIEQAFALLKLDFELKEFTINFEEGTV